MSGASGERTQAAPFFSAIVPTHEARDFVVDAIASVLGQTDADFEIVVLDNGSTDGTRDAVEAIGDERIVYRWQEDSGLPADSRNKAIALAQGRWLAFLDADDIWYPNKLAEVRAVIEANPGIDGVCHDVRVVDPAGHELSRRAYRLDSRPLAEQLFYRGNFFTTSAMTVRREAVLRAGGFDTRPEYFTVEDYDLWLRMAEAGSRFEVLPQLLGDYLQHPGGASARLVRHYDSLMRVFDDHACARARAGTLDVPAAIRRRTRSRLAEARDLARAGATKDATRLLVALPGERTAARRAYAQAATDGGHKEGDGPCS